MTDKEYRICVSGSPGDLARDVTELLSQGWELYGHPFAGAHDGNGNSNGHSGSASAFCQAMVRGQQVAAPVGNGAALGMAATAVASVEAPRIEAPRIEVPKRVPVAPLPKPRPQRPRVLASFRNVATFVGVMIVSYLLAEALIFRSGFYALYTEPEASTGGFERGFRQIFEHQTPAGKKAVLVVGNSRMAEGFSAKVANEHAAADGYDFLNAGEPGSGDRVWYYYVRDIDPQRNRYAAITIPIDDFDDPDDYEDVADRAGEIRLVVNRLRFTDILPYTLSFNSWKSQFEVFRGATLKGVVYQDDLKDFVEHPSQRLDRVRAFRKDGASWGYTYEGIPSTLAGLQVDYATKHITFPPNFPEGLKNDYNDIFFHKPVQRGMNRAFEVRWLSALVDLYKGSKTRIIVFQAPRGPAPNPTPLVHLPWTITDELRKRPWVTIVDRKTFEPLERPELFADYVHLNSDGRKLFSPMLADTVKETLH
jgi:hypothetical protein